MINCIFDEMLEMCFVVGYYKFCFGFGYGYNGVVFIDLGLVGVFVGKGIYYWDGVVGIWFWVDFENDFLFVGMI